MRFVETPVFTAAVQRHLDDDECRRLQVAPRLRPEQGPIIRGSGGVPKGPLGQGGRGKRGGLRIIYYWLPVEQTFYMLYIFSKTEQGDLTPSQTRTLGRLVREEFK